MASLYRQKDSVYFWVKFRNPITNKIVRATTGFRFDDPDGRRKALQVVNEKTRQELETPKFSNTEVWQAWVPDFLKLRYQNSPLTLRRACDSWVPILAYFNEINIPTPKHVTYSIVAGYMPWRLNKSNGLRAVKHNTAVLEVKFLSVIMRESVRRGYCTANPCRELEVRRIPVKQKPEITPTMEAKISEALLKAPEWMQDHWIILMRQGCRMSEAAVPLSEIDEFRGTIRFRIKGGKYHTAPLHSDILPILYKARDRGQTTLVNLPKSPAKAWHTFFRRVGFEISVHSTRVTVITRLLRQGFSPALVAAYIGHTEEINVVYRRLTPVDARHLGAALANVCPLPLQGNGLPEIGYRSS